MNIKKVESYPYRTSDGKLFLSEESAIEHEQSLYFKSWIEELDDDDLPVFLDEDGCELPTEEIKINLVEWFVKNRVKIQELLPTPTKKHGTWPFENSGIYCKKTGTLIGTENAMFIFLDYLGESDESELMSGGALHRQLEVIKKYGKPVIELIDY